MGLLNYKPDVVAQSVAATKLATMLTAMALLSPVQLFFRYARPHDAFYVPLRFHRMLCWLMGFKVRVEGAPATTTPILFVANHASYLDIPVLGSILPASFIAKADVASWPIIGFLARMQNTVFVERRASKAAQQRDQLQQRLAKGHNLVLFAEGTSSDGLRVLPFKSSLFSIAESAMAANSFTIQPVSITCTELDGLPLTRALRPYYAWYGDMTLAGHLWNVLKFGHFTVEVTFHASIRPEDFSDRKALAQYCQSHVARGIEHSLTRRPEPEPKAMPALTATKVVVPTVIAAKSETA
jgi:1-acyl-sn-glycerol-3-phosphate acyltransferase